MGRDSSSPTVREIARWKRLSERQAAFEAKTKDRRRWPAGPLHQAAARENLKSLKESFSAGNAMALMAAIRVCANHDLPLPDWASTAYIRAYDQVLNCRERSWDKVFGKPYGRRHLDDLRKRRQLLFAVYEKIRELLTQSNTDPQRNGLNGRMAQASEAAARAIDKSLFEDAGGSFGIGATLAEELYYKAKSLLEPGVK